MVVPQNAFLKNHVEMVYRTQKRNAMMETRKTKMGVALSANLSKTKPMSVFHEIIMRMRT